MEEALKSTSLPSSRALETPHRGDGGKGRLVGGRVLVLVRPHADQVDITGTWEVACCIVNAHVWHGTRSYVAVRTGRRDRIGHRLKIRVNDAPLRYCQRSWTGYTSSMWHCTVLWWRAPRERPDGHLHCRPHRRRRAATSQPQVGASGVGVARLLRTGPCIHPLGQTNGYPGSTLLGSRQTPRCWTTEYVAPV